MADAIPVHSKPKAAPKAAPKTPEAPAAAPVADQPKTFKLDHNATRTDY